MPAITPPTQFGNSQLGQLQIFRMVRLALRMRHTLCVVTET
jgi:hypothetical protein